MTEEEIIQKGFNAGYRLQKLKPELASQLQQGFSDKEHPYAQAFIAGTEQYVKDSSKDKSSFVDKYFNKIKSQTKTKSPDKGKSKDKGVDL